MGGGPSCRTAQRIESHFKGGCGKGLLGAGEDAVGIWEMFFKEEQTLSLATSSLSRTSRQCLSSTPTTSDGKPLETAASFPNVRSLLASSYCRRPSALKPPLLETLYRPQPPATSLLRTSTGGPWMAAPSFQQVTTLCSGLRLREGLNHHLLASNFLPKALRRKPDTSLEKRQAVTLHEYVPGHGGKRGVDVTNSNHSGSWGLLPTF